VNRRTFSHATRTPEDSCQRSYRTKVIANTGQSVQLSSERSLEGSTVSADNGVRETTQYIFIYIALTRNILISPEWGSDRSLIREYDSVRRGGREQALQKRDGGVKDYTTLAAIFDSGVDLIKVDEVGADIVNVVGRGLVEIFLAQN
jgi:hypothetical protein